MITSSCALIMYIKSVFMFVQLCRNLKNEGYTYRTLLFDNKYYDPEFGVIDGEYIYGKITSFLGIYQ